MNVLRQVFGVCSSSGEKSEIHDTVKRIFGNELLIKESVDKHVIRTKYVAYIKNNLPKYLENKMEREKKPKASKKSSNTDEILPENFDERHGRIGPRMVIFDASTGTGRLVLVGDERVSIQGLSSFASIRATACVYAGKWMYEVQLGTKGIMQIGWCTSSCAFTMDTGVGDTANSYAYDGGRVKRWNVITANYGHAWLPGDVIGSCINLDNGTLEYYRNGVSMGMAFNNVAHGSGIAYFPAVSLAMQEHLYANFGHVPFVFPSPGFQPIQKPPTKECQRAAILFRSLDALVDEFSRERETKAQNVSEKSSKQSKESTKQSDDEVTLRIISQNSIYKPSSQPKAAVDTQSPEFKKMSRKAFLMALTRIVVLELGKVLRISYVVISEFLPRLKASLGFREQMHLREDVPAQELFNKFRSEGFVNLSYKLLSQPHTRLCFVLDLLWTFLDESAFCDILEHCIVRECLLFDLVSPDLKFTRQIQCLYVICGLMQHRNTRHHLVKYILFNKITFDNFLHMKCPDESVLKSAVRKPWWQKPTGVLGEADPRVAEMVETGTIEQKKNDGKEDSRQTDLLDLKIEEMYKEDCNNINKSIKPLEQIQVEFMLMMLDNEDSDHLVPSTRKIFLEKFRRYIMDNCVLDMRLFNISRNTPAIFWCCHARLLTAVLKLWDNNIISRSNQSPHIPVKTYINGELDFYNVDRLGGVLPFLVRTLRQDLVAVLGVDNAFIQSFEPSYNRGGGVDTGVSEMVANSPGLVTLPQVISSMARFIHQPMIAMPNSRTAHETALAMKGTRSMMPGAGSVDHRAGFLRLLDGLLALYHGAAVKHAEKICEMRDNQQDMADCLYDIEQRISNIKMELNITNNKSKMELINSMLAELERSKTIYTEKLEASALQMAWVIGAIWTKQRQLELAAQFAGALHSLRMSSDMEYTANAQVASKEMSCRSYLIGNTSYSSLQLEYSSSSNQTSRTTATTATSRLASKNSSNNPVFINQDGAAEFMESLFAFVPEYHVDAMLELCNTLRLYMHPTVPVHQIPEWEDLSVSCAAFLCSEFADPRIILASTRESLVQTLASFATQPTTMRAIEKVPPKQLNAMIFELMRPYQNRSWAQSNWVLVRFWHGSGFGFRHRQWPHLAAKYGDREPTGTNLGAKIDAGLMSQCFGPCPSEPIQNGIKAFLNEHPKEAAAFLNSLLSQMNWAFSEFITILQEIDGIPSDSNLEPRQVKLCATCFDLYHGLARALEMTLKITPEILTKAEASEQQNDLLLGRTCQILMAVLSRVCIRSGGGGGFYRLMTRGLPGTDRVHYYVALAPIAGSLINMLNPTLMPVHLDKVTKALVTEPLFCIETLEFMLGMGKNNIFSFRNYPDDITEAELKALVEVMDRLKIAKELSSKVRSPGSSGTHSDLLCTICYARPADTEFVPCGHQSCRSCIMQHLLNSKQCFFCKHEIESVREVEVPTQ